MYVDEAARGRLDKNKKGKGAPKDVEGGRRRRTAMEGGNDEKEEKPRWRSRLTIKIGGQVSARPLAPRGHSAARAWGGGGERAGSRAARQ